MTEPAMPPRYLVKITCRRPDDGKLLQGTGVFFAPHFVLTCRHVVRYRRDSHSSEDTEWGRDIQVGWGAYGQTDPLPARIYLSDRQISFRDKDLVVLEVNRSLEPSEIPPWRSPGSSLRPGDEVTELAYPEGRFSECSRWIHAPGDDIVQTNGPHRGGASGGVLKFGKHPWFYCFAWWWTPAIPTGPRSLMR